MQQEEELIAMEQNSSKETTNMQDRGTNTTTNQEPRGCGDCFAEIAE